MARITVEDCLAKTDRSRFSLVLLAAKRAKMLIRGVRPLVDSDNKAVVNALREIAAGKVYATTEPIETAAIEGPRVQLIEETESVEKERPEEE